MTSAHVSRPNFPDAGLPMQTLATPLPAALLFPATIAISSRTSKDEAIYVPCRKGDRWVLNAS